jgi:hypothetical protein
LLSAVAFGNGMFVAVGSGGTILSSPDGTNWTARPSGTNGWFGHITYGEGVFVIAGMTSPDGIHWTEREKTGGKFCNGKFLALGSGSSFYESLDGINWTFNPGAGYLGASFPDIVFQNGTYVIVGANLSPEFNPALLVEMILTSHDGISWTQAYFDNSSYNMIEGITYANGYFVAVGSGGTIGTYAKTYVSTDGNNWTVTRINTPALPGSLYNVIYGNSTFVAVGGQGLIIQSDPLSGNCTATLSDDLTLHIPIINFNGNYIQGDAICQSDAGSTICRVINHRAANPLDYVDCQASTLTSDLRLQVPAGIYKDISYKAEFEKVPSADGQIWFKLISATKN